MLDKRKVKLMTKLALYEQNQGKEDMKISAYYKKDYVGMKMLITLIWTTIGYGVAAAAFLVAGIGTWMDGMPLNTMILVGIGMVIGYIVVLIICLIVSNRISSREHREARIRMKKYNHNLIRLLKMYGREKR